MSKIRGLFLQHNKKIIAILSLGIMLLFLIGYTMFVYITYIRPSESRTDTAYSVLNDSGNVVPLNGLIDGAQIKQTFVCDKRGISAIKIKFGTYGKKNKGNLMVSLINETTGDIIKIWNREEKKLKDNKYAKFNLSEDILQSSDQYSIVITSSGNKTFDELSLFVTESDSYASGQCDVDGVLQAGDINFKVVPAEVDNHFLCNYFWVTMLCMFALSGILWYKIFYKEEFVIEQVFLIFTMLMGFVYMLAMPAYLAPDEPVHVAEAYRISNILLGVENTDETFITCRNSDSIDDLGIEPSLTTYRYFYNNVFEQNVDYANEGLLKIGAPAISPIVAHLPQALGVTLARCLHLSYAALLYMGELFVIIFYSIIVYFAIKTIPVGKNIFMLMSGLPMLLQEMTSYATDSIICALMFLLMAYILKLIYEKERIQWKDYIFTVLVTFVLVPCKMVYFLIALLVVLIPKEKFISKMHSVLYKIGLPMIAIIRAFTFNSDMVSGATGGTNFISWANEEGYTVSYLLRNIPHLVFLCVNTVHEKMDLYTKGIIGGSLGWFRINLPFEILMIFVVLIVIAVQDYNEYKISIRHKIVYLVIAIGVIALIEASMLLAWTPKSYTWIEGVQGRYFLPILPLFLLCFGNATKEQALKNRKTLIMGLFFANYMTILEIFEYTVTR